MKALGSTRAALWLSLAASAAAAQPEAADGGAPAADEITVRAPRPRKEVGAAATDAEEARHLPLAGGDALAVVQSLPAAARAPAGSGALLVWGSTPAETRVLIDDVPVPWLFHKGGLRSALSPALLESVELVPAGYGPAFGRGTGGLVRVGTRSSFPEGFSGGLGADFVDGAADASWRQAEAGPHAVALAGRYGWLSRLLPAVVPGVERTVPLPESWDYAGKWQHKGGDDATQLSLFGAGDTVNRPFPGGGGERSASQFHRAAFRHHQPLAGGGRLEAGLWLGADLDRQALDFVASSASQKALALRAGTRASLRQSLLPELALTLGVDVEGSRVESERQGSLSLPAREGDLGVFGQPPGDRVAFDRWTTHSLLAAAFAELELSLGRMLTVRPGVRLELAVAEGERLLPPAGGSVDIGFSRLEPFAEPRLSVLFRPLPQLHLSAAAGLYHQGPEPAELSSVFGNTALGSASAFHGVLGATVRPVEALSVELTGYYKQAWGLAARSSADFPRVAQALVGTGEGRSYGGQVVLRPAAWKWLSGWASYALSKSERRASPAAAWRLFDFDQTHQFLLVASVELPWGIRLGPRFRVATGYPTTPVVGAVYDARTDAWQPVRGEQNSARLPTFVQLDARAEKTFAWSALRLSVWLDVINVTNARNVEEVTWSHDYQEQGALTGLPVLAVLGARLEL